MSSGDQDRTEAIDLRRFGLEQQELGRSRGGCIKFIKERGYTCQRHGYFPVEVVEQENSTLPTDWTQNRNSDRARAAGSEANVR